MMLGRGGATRIVVTLSSSVGLSFESVLDLLGRIGRRHMPLRGHSAWDRRRYTRLRSHGLGFLLEAI